MKVFDSFDYVSCDDQTPVSNTVKVSYYMRFKWC